MDNATQRRIAAAVDYVAHSGAPLVEFAPGPLAEAVHQAVAAGYLSYVGNGGVQLAAEFKHLSRQKDPEGIVLNHMAAMEMLRVPSCIPVLDVSELHLQAIVGATGDETT